MALQPQPPTVFKPIETNLTWDVDLGMITMRWVVVQKSVWWFGVRPRPSGPFSIAALGSGTGLRLLFQNEAVLAKEHRGSSCSLVQTLYHENLPRRRRLKL